MYAIKNCRIPDLGYHSDQCNHSGHIEQEHNSCKDRHWPKCQGMSRTKCIDARLKEVLAVPYCLTVFTLPHILKDLSSCNEKPIYDLLPSKPVMALLASGYDLKWLGGEFGFYGVLHTCGQTLWPRAHAHFVVAARDLTDKAQWVNTQ